MEFRGILLSRSCGCAGVPVRTIQVSSAFRAIDAHEHVCAIVLLEDRPEGVIMLYDLGPGDLITSFGRVGTVSVCNTHRSDWDNDVCVYVAHSSLAASFPGTMYACQVSLIVPALLQTLYV